MLSISLLLAMVVPAFASPAYPEIESTKIGYDLKGTLDKMLDEGQLLINSQGRFELASDRAESTLSVDQYTDLCYRILLLNSSIALGTAKITQDGHGIDFVTDLSALTSFGDTTANQEVEAIDHALYEMLETRAVVRSSHQCTYNKLSLGFMVSANKKIIEDYYQSILAVNPTAATNSTIGYWIARVQEGGVWDYKRNSEIGPWDNISCCDYWTYTNAHRTAEWIGNYNYGYTGAFLFSLSVLKAGSFAASGFRETDSADWPAIEEGFTHSTS